MAERNFGGPERIIDTENILKSLERQQLGFKAELNNWLAGQGYAQKALNKGFASSTSELKTAFRAELAKNLSQYPELNRQVLDQAIKSVKENLSARIDDFKKLRAANTRRSPQPGEVYIEID